MRRGAGLVLIGLGVFLVVLAPLLRFYAVPALAKAPLKPSDPNDPDRTITLSSGTAVKLFDPSVLKERENVALTATRVTRGDVSASEQDPAKAEGWAVYDTFQRLQDDSGTVVNAVTNRYAFDRVSSELKDCCGANAGGEQVAWAGVMPLKFPFFVEQRSYEYFDDTLRKPVTIDFVSTEDIEGVTTYKFQQTIEPTQIGTQELPGDLVGSTDASFVAPRFYGNTRTLWVDPTTGAIVKGTEDQKQTFRGPDGTDKVTVIEATLGFTPEQVKASAEVAKENAAKINLLKNTVPLLGLLLGLALVVAGALLARRPATAGEEREVVLTK